MDKKTPKTTAQKLRECRKNSNLSQRQVADAIGIERSAYSYYESHRVPKLSMLQKIATVLNVDIIELLPDEETSFTVKDYTANKSPIQIYSLSSDEQALILKYRMLNSQEKTDLLAKMTNKQEQE